MRCLVFFGFASLAGAWTAYKGLRATDEELRQMASTIGTKNPTLARVVCWLAFVPLTAIGGGIVGSYLIFEIRYLMGRTEDAFDEVPYAFGFGLALAIAGVVFALTRGERGITRPPTADEAFLDRHRDD